MAESAAREMMEFDVVVVGAGPSGLSAAIRLKQLAPEATVCVVEKGSEVGAHILSGAVIEPRSLDELLPGWRDGDAPLTTQATDDRFLYLTETRAWRLQNAVSQLPMRKRVADCWAGVWAACCWRSWTGPTCVALS